MVPLDDLSQLSATELARMIRAREVSSLEVTEAILARMDGVNEVVNAVVTVTDELARSRARAADEAVRAGGGLGPLHGVPYTAKDLTETAGIRTTMGSRLFENYVPDFDALVFARLKAAGGVLVGKTNTPEFGAKGVTDNPVFGITRNPWDPSRTPGGSSGGAAVAVATGLAPIAEGSDFAGSVRIPASFCGVVGFKPSNGRIPNVPNSMTWHALSATHGPITRTVADAALMLQVMAGPDARDPISLDEGPYAYPEVVAGDLSLRGMRVGYSPDLGFVPVDPEVAESCAAAVRVFADLGCEVEEVGVDFSDSEAPYRLLNGNARAAGMRKYSEEEQALMDPLMRKRSDMSAEKTATDVAVAEIEQGEIYRRVYELFTRYDFLVLPATPVAPHLIDLPVGFNFPTRTSGVTAPKTLTALFNMTGHPAISVPSGWTPEGLPIGLQIVGPWHDDERVLRVAAAYEQAAPWRHRWPAMAAPRDEEPVT